MQKVFKLKTSISAFRLQRSSTGRFDSSIVPLQYLWCVHQIHLQQACLQRTLHGPVVLQGIEQEGRALLDQVVLHEHVNDLHTEKKTNELTCEQ